MKSPIIPGPVGRQNRRVSLQRKIMIWSFVPTVLILLAVALVNFQAYIKVTEDLVLQRNRELARLKAAQLSSELSELQDMLEKQALRLSGTSLDFYGSPINEYRRAELLKVFDQGLVIMNNLGEIIVSAPEGAFETGQNWGRTPIYSQVILHHEARSAISDILAIGPGGEPVIAVAVPVMNQQGRFEGILVGLIGLQPDNVINDSISRLRLESRGNAYLVDGNGLAIYHYQPDKVMTDISEQPLVKQVLAGKVGTQRTHDENGKDIVASYAPVLGTRWGLLTQENWTALLGSSQAYIWFLLGLLLLGVAAPTVMVALGVRRITRPLAELTLAAQEVAGGNFDRTIHATTNDEVAELAEQFNRMSGQLQESYASLEQRVADRTRELATLNRISAVVSRSLDLSEILENALETTCEAVRMEAGAVFLQDGDYFNLITERGLSEEFLDTVERLPAVGSAAGQAARSGGPVVRAVEEYPEGDLRSSIAAEGLRLIVSVPLLARGQTLGVMNLCTRISKSVTPEELEMLAAVGGQVGVAVENSRLYRQAEQAAAAAERSRLARDLHDAVTQTLFSASLIAEVLPRLWERSPEDARSRLEELRQLNRGALAEMRSLLLELRPSALHDANMNELFRHLADAFTGRTRLPVSIILDGEADLPGEVKIAFYRIAQEALNNIGKHAAAKMVNLELSCHSGRVRLTVRDDGRGFDPGSVPADHLGLRIMSERAKAAGAELMVQSRPGAGTVISVEWVDADRGLETLQHNLDV